MKLKNLVFLLSFVFAVFVPCKSFATCSNYVVYSDGTVLTAGSLNSLQTNYTNCVNNVLNGDTFTGDMNFHSGSDATFYSDAGTTLAAKIDGTSGAMTGYMMKEGTYGLTLSYSSSTLKITCNNAVCSDSNPGWVVMQSQATPGQLVALKITTDTHNFIDDSGASDIVGQYYDTTSGVAWSSSKPFFIYAVNKDDTSANLLFSLSTMPHMKTTSSNTNYLCYKGNPCATQDNRNNWFFTSSSPSTYTSKPELVIGSFLMKKSTSDDWTVQTLTNNDGIGQFNDNTLFTFPTGQMGASASTYIFPNGGTAFRFSSETYKYQISKNGLLHVIVDLSGDGTTDGAGAVATRLAVPFSLETSYSAIGYVLTAGGVDQLAHFYYAGNFYLEIRTSGATALNLSSFSNGNRYIRITFTAMMDY